LLRKVFGQDQQKQGVYGAPRSHRVAEAAGGGLLSYTTQDKKALKQAQEDGFTCTKLKFK
jgi:hypothetical protein